MNIGSIARNANGHLVGSVSTLTMKLTIALRAVHSNNPNAPVYEIMALSAAREWIKVGALFEQAANNTGLVFHTGKIEDPSLAAPLYISMFRQDDGSFNIVWSRPTRRRELPAEMAVGDEALPPLPGESRDRAPAEEGLGNGTAEGAFAD
jgi:uncharacterized protein (DUF736 family)